MILDLATLKLLINVPVGTTDEYLQMLLDYSEELIFKYTNKAFLVGETTVSGITSFSGNEITLPFNLYITVGTIWVEGSVMNDGLYEVSDVNGNVLTVGKTLKTEGSLAVCVYTSMVGYTDELGMVQADMVSYDLAVKSGLIKKGITSESQGARSISYEAIGSNFNYIAARYPVSITSGLKAYRKSRVL
jgi:hypothetical protein